MNSNVFVNSATEVPFWPDPFCAVNAPQTTCTFLGITVNCKEPITWDSQFADGIEGGHVWTFFVLFFLGVAALAYTSRPWSWKDSMKITCALYSAETAFFAIFRIFWGLGKPLIVGAALHNLFEWSIVLHVVAETKSVDHFKRNIRLAAISILTVVSLTIMIPNLLLAFLLEQATGIMLDFGMPLMFLSQWLNKNNSAEVRKFYSFPAIAHTIHILFTIIPLVMANFHVGTTSWYSSFWLELFIYVSAPVTHILYIVWSWDVDKKRQVEDMARQKSSFRLLPEEYRFKGAKKFIGIGFVLGILTLVVYPQFILKPCTYSPPKCVTEGTITGTSVAMVNRGFEKQFIELVEEADLIKEARRHKGNIAYDLVQNDNQPREFRFIEKWRSHEDLVEWINSDTPRNLFDSKDMKKALAKGGLVDFDSYSEPGSECFYQ